MTCVPTNDVPRPSRHQGLLPCLFFSRSRLDFYLTSIYAWYHVTDVMARH